MSILKLLSLPATPDALILQDLSTYVGIPSSPRLILSTPGRATAYSLPFTIGVNNVITTVQITTLPDGIYIARLAIIPYATTEICYSFLRVENLECRIQAWLQGYDWASEPLNGLAYQTLARVSALVLAAKAAALAGEGPKAITYYTLAKKALPAL